MAEGKSLQETVKQLQEVVERRYLEAALRQTRGRVGMAARLAGIHSRSMYNKMQQYGIDKAQFKKKDRRET